MSWMICQFFSTHSDKASLKIPKPFNWHLCNLFQIKFETLLSSLLSYPSTDRSFSKNWCKKTSLVLLMSLLHFMICQRSLCLSFHCSFIYKRCFLLVFSHSVLEYLWFHFQMFMLYVYSCLWQSHPSVSSLSFEVREELCFSHWALFTLLLFRFGPVFNCCYLRFWYLRLRFWYLSSCLTSLPLGLWSTSFVNLLLCCFEFCVSHKTLSPTFLIWSSE